LEDRVIDRANAPADVLVLGSGNFGTCLAQHLAESGKKVLIWTRSEGTAQAINQTHKNPKYLNTVTLSDRISATSNISAESVSGCRTIVFAIPTQAMRETVRVLKPFLTSGHLLICANKGIEVASLKLPGDIVSEELGEKFGARIVVLSGPSFASEIITHQPTAVVAASFDESAALQAQQLFHAPHFRVYTSSDPIGVEIAGALKNVIAIAAGACAGLGMQNNSRAALLTRGLAEITRFGVRLGAVPLTFNGLSGVGDLFLTCTSEKSRNFTVGYRIGRGETLAEVQGSVGSVAEGVTTAKAARDLAAQLKISAPITEQVYQVLYENKSIKAAVLDLLTRDAKPELDPVVTG
jgi:glycerol-3-phosphate dehydrogenase (NAD(P)+)